MNKKNNGPVFGLVIAAAGNSLRMGEKIPKQYRDIEGEPMFIKAARAFVNFPEIASVSIAVRPGDEAYAREVVSHFEEAFPCAPSNIFIAAGGGSRRDSCISAFSLLPKDAEYILVHDASRPFTPEEVIRDVIDALKSGEKAVVPGVTPKSTIRTLEKTFDRSKLFEAQTPQGFSRSILEEAYKKAVSLGIEGTDDAGLAEKLEIPIKVTKGSYENIKITTPEDFPKEHRTGMGYDIHRLIHGRKLMLCCTEIPCEKGLLGHSDADAASHALADAMLGAAALGDIGKYFPEDNPAFEGASGREILSKTKDLLSHFGFTLSFADVTLIAEEPKLSPYIYEMRKNMSEALGLSIENVSVKATTNEGLGPCGEGLAIAAMALANIRKL